jgi:hypothetical protein
MNAVRWRKHLVISAYKGRESVEIRIAPINGDLRPGRPSLARGKGILQETEATGECDLS